MEQKIEAPTEDEFTYVAQMLIHAECITKEIIGEVFDGSIEDLNKLQRIIDSKQIEPESTQSLQSLGLVFGKVFLLNNEGFDWWAVEDEYGRDICVRYKETTLLTFPQTMISKRIEDGKIVDINDMYFGLVETVEELIEENYQNA
jgi:hypothetical protein